MSRVAEPTPRSRQPVIQRKLERPVLPEHFAGRQRVRDQLRDLIARKRVVVLTATAGSGKTTALVEALGDSPRTVAWLTVDHTDTAPGRLVTYLEAALGKVLPDIEGTVMSALAAGVPHAETAGLLAQAVGDREVTFILDELERLGEVPEAWAVIDALIRHATPGMVVVLISRRPIPPALCTLAAPDVAVFGDVDVAFTAAEAAAALERLGKTDVDVENAVRDTAGWVTGVLFVAWKADERIAGLGGETDPLYGYLASQMIGQLDPRDEEFLTVTSLLPEVTIEGARALGMTDPDARLRSLRSHHLPATWGPDGRTLRCHSYLREFLLERLERRGDARKRRLALGRWLASEHHDEQAVEEFLRAGAPDDAIVPAERVILDVVDRLDFAVARRWLDAFGRAPDVSPLTTADLMLAIASDDANRLIEICDALEAAGKRLTLAVIDERARWMMVWAYLHVARWDDIPPIVAAASPAEREGIRFVTSALTDVEGERPPDPPAPDSALLKPMLSVALWCRGRLRELADDDASGWVTALERPWRIAALRALGRTSEALALFDQAEASGIAGPTMLTFVAPDLLMDAGRYDAAEDVVIEARRVAARSGSLAYQTGACVIEARYALRIRRDPVSALAALGREECLAGMRGYPFLAEYADTLRGHALLLEGRDDEAFHVLERAMNGMTTGDRTIQLSTCAIYFAEAAWRVGPENAANDATDLALEIARRHGSDHLLLQAIADFPAVLSRRLEIDDDPDSAWHALARSLAVQGAATVDPALDCVALSEFAERALRVGGEEVKPRIAKSYELVAYLSARGPRGADREELLEALFGGRRDDSTRAYLRQAVLWVRRVLPEGTIETRDGRTRLAHADAVVTESQQFEQHLAAAMRLRDVDRLEATLSALEIFDAGEYMPGGKGPWATSRERELSARAAEARNQAAALAMGLGRHDQARSLVDRVLEADPFHEAAWRLAMRVAHETGDEDGVLRRYKACEAALAELGATPSPSTRRLLTQIRR